MFGAFRLFIYTDGARADIDLLVPLSIKVLFTTQLISVWSSIFFVSNKYFFPAVSKLSIFKLFKYANIHFKIYLVSV